MILPCQAAVLGFHDGHFEFQDVRADKSFLISGTSVQREFKQTASPSGNMWSKYSIHCDAAKAIHYIEFDDWIPQVVL